MTKTSCQECIEAVKNATQERVSKRSQVIEVPKTSRQESVEVVENSPLEKNSEWCQVIEVPKTLCQGRAEVVKIATQVRISDQTETSSQDRSRHKL